VVQDAALINACRSQARVRAHNGGDGPLAIPKLPFKLARVYEPLMPQTVIHGSHGSAGNGPGRVEAV